MWIACDGQLLATACSVWYFAFEGSPASEGRKHQQAFSPTGSPASCLPPPPATLPFAQQERTWEIPGHQMGVSFSPMLYKRALISPGGCDITEQDVSLF